MECPKCGKLLSKRISNTEQDGGIRFFFHCDKCNSDYSAFVTQFDLENVYDETEDYDE